MRDTKIGTQNRYRDIIKNQLAPHIGDIPLTDLSPRHIDELFQTVLDEGLDAGTVELVGTVISGACKHALRLEKIHRNPAAVVPAPKKQKKEIQIPEMDQVHHLLRQAKAEGHYLFVFIYLLVYTGMRRGEAMAVRWANVNLKERYIDVVEQAVQDGSGGVRLETLKTERSKRRLFLVPRTVRLLALHKEAQRAERAGSDPEELTEDKDLVFPDHDGSWMKPNNLLRHLKELAERSGIDSITFHKFRHFHASTSLEADADLFATSQALGHSNISTTPDMYGHITDSHRRTIADGFARAMEDADLDTDPKGADAYFPPDFPPDDDPTESE